jgi:hypothetical protein
MAAITPPVPSAVAPGEKIAAFLLKHKSRAASDEIEAGNLKINGCKTFQKRGR